MTRKIAVKGIVSGLLAAMAACPSPAAPLKSVLHFTKVGYFEHVGGIQACTHALDSLASRFGFTVKVSKDYDDLAVLSANPGAYDIVVFDNNTDAGGVTNKENAGQMALKDWLTNKGGRILCIHSAADHRGQWAWYDTVLFSAIRFSNFGNGSFTVYRDTSKATRENPALRNMYQYAEDSLGLPTEELKFNTESYHFRDSRSNLTSDVRGRPGVTGFQELRGKDAMPVNTNQVISWIKTLPNQGRFIYTALGHEVPEWNANNGWLSKMTWAYLKYLMGDFDATATAIPPRIQIQGHSLRVLNPEARGVQIVDIAGRVVASGTAADFGKTLPKAGVYFVRVDAGKGKLFSKAITLD